MNDAVDGGYDYLLFVDDDIVLPEDALENSSRRPRPIRGRRRRSACTIAAIPRGRSRWRTGFIRHVVGAHSGLL